MRQQWTYATMTPDGTPIPYEERTRNDVMTLCSDDAAKVLAPFLESHVNICGIANGLKCNPSAVEDMLRACLRGRLAEQVITRASYADDLLAQMMDVWKLIGDLDVQFPPPRDPNAPTPDANGAVTVNAVDATPKSLCVVLKPLLTELAARRTAERTTRC